ncbi:MAG: TAXI family TRAP transporter solute-binding subunit [Actinocatenispora sp.]
MKRRSLLCGLAGSGVGGLLSGCGEDPGPLLPMPLATGEAGGVYLPIGRALADSMQMRWRPGAQVTAGSVENLERLRDHRSRIAFTTVDVAAQAMGGLGEFRTKVGVRALAGLYSDYVHVVTRHSLPSDLNGLAGRRVSTGAPGSGTEVVAARLMAAAGITVRGFERHRLGLRESVRALCAGIIDAFFFSGGLPTPAIFRLITSDSGAQLLDVSGYVDPLQSQYGEVYSSGFITNSVYGYPSKNSVCIPNVLVVSPSMDDETAYELTRLLFAAKYKLGRAHAEGNQLDPHSALATYPVPLHPGAEQFFREQKDA